MLESISTRIGLTIILLGAVLCPRFAVATQDPYESKLAETRALLEQRRLAESLGPLAEALRARPDGPDALWLMGVVSLELRQFDNGLPHVRHMVELLPDELQPRLLLAAYYEAMGRLDEATVEYREVLSREPGHHEALLVLGRLGLQMQDAPAARPPILRLVELYPNDVDGYKLLGRLHAQDGANREALDAFTRAEELAPDAEVHYLLGALYARLGHREDAHRHLEAALQLQPDSGPTVFELGLLAADEERSQEALERFIQATRLMPSNPEAHFRLGEARQYLREMPMAESAYKTALALDPDLVAARLQLGMLYIETARAGEALVELRRAAELAPDDARIQYQLGLATEAVGDAEAARRHLEACLRLDPSHTEAHLALGNLLMRRGETDAGRELLERFRQLETSDGELEAHLAELSRGEDDTASRVGLVRRLLAEQRYSQARDIVTGWVVGRPELCDVLARAYTEALSETGDAPEVLLGLGNLLVECGDAEQALTYLVRARRLGPVSSAILHSLARAYEMNGQPEMAAEARKQAAQQRSPSRSSEPAYLNALLLRARRSALRYAG